MQGCVLCCALLHCDLLCVLCCVVLHYIILCFVLYFVLRVKFTWIKICYVFCCAVLQCVVLFLCCFLLHCIVLCCVLRATSPLLQDHPRQYGCAHWAHLALCTISINLSSLSQTCIMQFCSNNNPAKILCHAEPIWPILHFVQFQ